MRTILIPGLWFNINGPIADHLRNLGIDIANVLGMNLEERITLVVKMLNDFPNVETIIGHSAGCVVLSHIIKRGLLPKHIKVVMLNSGPLPGIKFKPKDLTFRALMNPVYLFKMTFGLMLALTDRDIMKLMSIPKEDLEEVKKSLVADSGTFVRQIVLSQFKKRFKPGFIQKALGHANVWVFTARLDNMIGSTGRTTAEIYRGINITEFVGHLKAILDFDHMLKLLREAGCKI